MSATSINPTRTVAGPRPQALIGGTLLWLVTILMGGAAWIYAKSIVWSIVGPLAGSTLVTLGFIVYLRRIGGAMPYFEIGLFSAAITFLYCAYPLAVYVFNRYSFPEWGDPRLFMMRFRPDELGVLAWWYVLYLFCFCVAYAIARGRGTMRARLKVVPPDATTIAAIVLLLLGTRLFFGVLGRFFNLTASSYLDQYLIYQRLPLLLRQIAVHLRGIDLTLQMMLVIALCCARRQRYRIILVAVLVITTVSHLLYPGARVGLFAVILAFVAAFDLTVRRIPLRWIAAGSTIGFFLLLGMGLARQEGVTSMRRLPEVTEQLTEFEIIFGNAVDLKYFKEVSGGFIGKPSLYWSSLFALVPQQLLPVQKDTPADWYVREYYPAGYATGGGLAFGVLSEAVMGYGVVEIVWRGLLVGVLLGLLHRRLMRGQVSLGFLMFYIWAIVWSYQTIRTGSLAPLVMVLHHFVAPLLGILILGAVLRRGRRAARRLAGGESADHRARLKPVGSIEQPLQTTGP
jgi:hypothetical protein